MIARLAAAAAALLALAGCQANTPERVQVQTYDVYGASPTALAASLRERAPRSGISSISVRFLHSFKPALEGGACRYNADGEVGLIVDRVRPKWRSRELASADVQRRWDVVDREIDQHGVRHLAVSRRYARRIEAAYRGSSAPTCRALEAQMRREIQAIAAEHSREQDALGDTPQQAL